MRAPCGAISGPEALNLHGILERLTQFEGPIQNRQHLPYAKFRAKKQTDTMHKCRPAAISRSVFPMAMPFDICDTICCLCSTCWLPRDVAAENAR